MQKMIRVAVDTMTSEKGVQEGVHGAIRALKEYKDLQVILVGDPAQVKTHLRGKNYGERLEIFPAMEIIGMDEEPGAAFKAKKDASVTVAARLVQEGKADAACSPGNTGASLAAATFVLGRIKGVRRPSLMTLMPSSHGSTALLDSGAVVDCKIEDLVQWGIMGSLYMKEVRGFKEPRVGLLSIGEEEGKGNSFVRDTLPLMKAAPFNFMGNVEGRDIFNGRCEVVVCDGFVGNVVLKTAEGIAKMIIAGLKESFLKGNVVEKFGGLLSRSAINRFKGRVSADELGGAILMGVNGIFVISHGAASRIMMKNAIRLCYECAKQDITAKLVAQIAAAGASA